MEQLMKWMVENWFLLVALIAIIAAIVYFAIRFFKMPTKNQIEALKVWLEHAVRIAEQKLGEKTGQLKLRMVYDMALERFPWVETMISFEAFSQYVDEALVWLDNILETNETANAIVTGTSDNTDVVKE